MILRYSEKLGIVQSVAICILQADLDKLILWAQKWQMEFNVDKCKVMHIGNSKWAMATVIITWKEASYLVSAWKRISVSGYQLIWNALSSVCMPLTRLLEFWICFIFGPPCSIVTACDLQMSFTFNDTRKITSCVRHSSRKRVQQLKKRKKSCFWGGFWKKR